jgi:succinate dehydrogenase / fumarate reductase, iron-sulfur subunit
MMNKDNEITHNITYHIRRFNPEKDSVPYWGQFKVKVKPGMTVLEGLHQIKETHDNSLSWRFSCRMGVCGSCGMMINGKLSLACNTQILDLSNTALTIGPIPNFSIIKDLVPDLTPLFERHCKVHPYIKRDDLKDMDVPSGELYQTPEELDRYLQFAYCIKCGMCMGACPTMATDKDFLGPMPLAQAYRYCTDTRDGGFHDRKEFVGTSHGVFRCHYAAECSNVCPKGVDPARAVQFMKRDLVLDYLKLKKRKSPCKEMGHYTGKPIEGIPKPPAFTVE